MSKRKIRRANVIDTHMLTPHLKRIKLGSDEFKDFPRDQIGAYVKVLLPHSPKQPVELDLNADNPAFMRSYTIADIDELTGAITLDFVVNMHKGKASLWAQQAEVCDEVGIAGPGPRKLTEFNHESYIMVADLTSINAVNAYCHLLPEHAYVDVFIHVNDRSDVIELSSAAIKNRTHHWLITTDPETDIVNAISTLMHNQPLKPVFFMAAEASVVKAVNRLCKSQFKIESSQIFCSAYWKKGVDADGLKVEKQQQSDA